ncbi:MAG TPA: PQQ-binding-like beta-propeller repeat protein [Candidatus Dormibacteraeota bacterium]|nr:PQQ-binding-like beta-propeller repeat protein [Candidatus Dormibacteraeota bacterium]
MSRRLTLTLALLAIATLLTALPAGAGNWPTYHHDPARTGVDPLDPSFISATPGHTSATLDGKVYAEPLAFNGSVYVATENNTIYALDSSTLATQWSVHFHAAAPLSEVQAASAVGCGGISPLGITGTPVIDPAVGLSGTLFAVEETWDNNAGVTHAMHQLVKLDLNSHLWSASSADPPGVPTHSDSQNVTSTGVEQQRAALALAGGHVIVNYGGRGGDCGRYHGYVVSANESDLAVVGSFATTPDFTAAGLWGPSGPAVDGSGNVFVATGNSGALGECSIPKCGNDNSHYEYSESVLRLNSTAGLIDSWAPGNWQDLNTTDTDVGSIGPTLLDGGLLFQGGKEGVGYLLVRAQLSGKVGGGIGGQAFSARVCHSNSDQMFGGAAYFNGVVYVGCSDGLAALSVDTANATFTTLWYNTTDFLGRSQPPIVAGGAVWSVDHGNNTLHAVDRLTGGTRFRVAVPGSNQNQFMTPAAGDGQVFIAGNSGGGGRITSIALNATQQTRVAGAVGTDNALWVLAGTGGGFSSAGGGLSAAPAIATMRPASSGATAPAYIANAPDHNLWVSDGAGRWVPLTTGGTVFCLDNPAAVTQGARGTGTLTVACEGGDNALWYAQATLPTSGVPQVPHSAWVRGGGRLLAGPAVTFLPLNGSPTFEVLGTDNRAWEMNPADGPGFTQSVFACVGHPAAATDPGGKLAYFACHGTDDRLWYATNNGSGWSGASPAGGTLVDGPGIAATAAGATFYVEGTDHAVWENSLAGSALTTFQKDGGAVKFGVGAAGL